MKAFLLAAGLGKRLRPLTNSIPKPMILFKGKPLLEHQIVLLKKYGIKDFIINVHWLPKQIKNYFKDGKSFGVSITYSYESELLGDAGALKKCANFLDETFLVMYGDLIAKVDLASFFSFHKKKGGIATVAVAKEKKENLSSKGVIGIDEKNMVISFEEKPQKPKSNLISAGIFLFEPEIFSFIPKNKTYMLGQHLFPCLLQEKQKIYAWPIEGTTRDILELKNKLLR